MVRAEWRVRSTKAGHETNIIIVCHDTKRSSESVVSRTKRSAESVVSR